MPMAIAKDMEIVMLGKPGRKSTTQSITSFTVLLESQWGPFDFIWLLHLALDFI